MRNQKGFTLIELMIVIAILGILAAMLVPAFQSFKNGGNGQTPNMGTQGGEAVASTKVSYLVCKDSTGAEVKREPAIPGERWSYENGVYVTVDANGNPHTIGAESNDCTIE